jgi:hypothetical protein
MKKILFVLTVFAIVILLSVSKGWADINNGLVAYWPFNYNLNDVTGNGHDGEMINGSVLYIQGVKGKGIKLPGTTDARISLPPWVPANSSLTISGWVNVSNQDELWNGYQGPIYISQHGDFSHGFVIRPVMRDYELHAEFGIGANVGTGNRIHCVLEPIEFYGTWHHMVGVVDRENHEIKLYYDGELVATSMLTVDAIYPTKGFIGSYDYLVARNGNTRFVSPSHRLDEIRLYNRVLSEDEIQDLFSMGQCTYGPEDQPLTFIRKKGRPNIDTIQWDSCGGPGLLKISANSVSSAIIYLNGIRIASPANFNNDVTQLEFDIELFEGENILQVQLNGKPGGYLAFECHNL